MDEMLADLISEGTREGMESARACGQVGGRRPKLTTRQAEVARSMYDETGADDRRRYTVAEMAETFGVSRKTVYRHLEPSADRRQPGKSTRSAAPAGPLATLPDPPTTAPASQPHGPVIDVSCSCCGNGPLITRQPPELGDQLAQPALDWLHARGWQLHPPQIAASCDATVAIRCATPIVSTPWRSPPVSQRQNREHAVWSGAAAGPRARVPITTAGDPPGCYGQGRRAERRLGAARSCADGVGGRLQIVRFWASVVDAVGPVLC